MPELCQNCGAELYEGQQFCRRCGTPVGAGSRPAGEAPTQLFPQGPAPGVARAGGGTGRVEAGQPTAYHAAAGFQRTAPLVGQPFDSRPLAVEPRRGRRGAWVAALLVVFMLGAGLASGAAYLWWRATRRPVVVRKITTGGGFVPAPPGAPAVPDIPDIPAIPDLPADIGERISEALKGKGVPLPLDESGAVVSGDATVLTRTFEIDSDSSFSAHVVGGDVTVVGADADEAVVKIVKRGGSPQARAAARVLAAESEEGVMLLSAAAPDARVSVSYEITVPRGLRQLEISARKGDIKVNNFDGSAVLNLTTGNVSVSATGAVRSRVINGRTSVGYVGRHEGPQEFEVVNGDVDVFLKGGGQEVDLKATATNGRIEVDRMIAVKAERRGSGQRVEAELGGGGAPLEVKVVNGNIRLKP